MLWRRTANGPGVRTQKPLVTATQTLRLTQHLRTAATVNAIWRRTDRASLKGRKFVPDRYFHDVPAKREKREWNVDHVAVGPGSVFVLETKARAKMKATREQEESKAARGALPGRDAAGNRRWRGPRAAGIHYAHCEC